MLIYMSSLDYCIFIKKDAKVIFIRKVYTVCFFNWFVFAVDAVAGSKKKHPDFTS